MGPPSVRRPLLVYALVFCTALAFAMATASSFALLELAQTASHWTRTRELQAIVSGRTPEQGRQAVAERGLGDVAVVTASVTAFGVDVRSARRIAGMAIDPGPGGGLSAARIEGNAQSFLVARDDPSALLSRVRGQIRFLLITSMIGALITGVLLSVMIARLMLPPLSALRELAGATELTAEGLTSDETPNEIAEVAVAFRRTVRKLQEEREAITRQHAELERMQASLIRASKLASVGRLAAGIAHEIGNPLAAVRGYMSLLSAGLDADAEREVLERSSSELNRIHETIQKLLTYARRDDEGASAPFDVAEVVDDSIALVRGHPAMRNLTIETEIAPATRCARGRPGPLGQVLVNLLLNAAHAVADEDDGGIVVRVQGHGERVELHVEDDGPGVAEDKMEQIFDPFFTTKPPGEGTGLGLAVSRALIERMDGDLSVSNAEHGGARFTVSLAADSAEVS